MRKIFLIVITLLTVTATYSQNKKRKPVKKKPKTVAEAGMQIGYVTSLESGGGGNFVAGLVGEFGVMKNLSIVPSFNYHFTEKVEDIKTTVIEANLDGQYYFLNQKGFKLYGLAGLNYTHVTSKVEIPAEYAEYAEAEGGSEKSSDGNIGFNIGTGIKFDFGGKIVPFSTLRFTIADGSAFGIFAGAKYAF
ncbi:hypothetical protein [Flavobacterium terrae]|nr:hypothetical protein [Flavobacterium terrae]